MFWEDKLALGVFLGSQVLDLFWPELDRPGWTLMRAVGLLCLLTVLLRGWLAIRTYRYFMRDGVTREMFEDRYNFILLRYKEDENTKRMDDEICRLTMSIFISLGVATGFGVGYFSLPDRESIKEFFYFFEFMFISYAILVTPVLLNTVREKLQYVEKIKVGKLSSIHVL